VDCVSKARVASLAAQHRDRQRSIVLKTFVRQQYAGRHFCPKSCSEQCFRGKGLKRERPRLFASQVTKAKLHLPRVGYINLTTGLMATTPSPGVTYSTSQTSLSQPTVWCSFFSLPFWGGFDQSLIFISLSLTDTPSFSSPALQSTWC